MITLNLAPIFKARGIDKPYTFLVKSGLSPHIATRLVSNKASVLSLEHISLLCRVLFCEPNDLFLWTQDQTHPLSDDHPLMKLAQQEAINNFKDIISTMSLKQLKEMTKTLAEKGNI